MSLDVSDLSQHLLPPVLLHLWLLSDPDIQVVVSAKRTRTALCILLGRDKES